jgi:hypothetical protein
MLVTLSGSFQTTPNFYLDPKSGVTYNVAIQAPQYRLDSLAALKSLPSTGREYIRSAQQRRGAGRWAPTGYRSPAFRGRCRCAGQPGDPSCPARNWAQ